MANNPEQVTVSRWIIIKTKLSWIIMSACQRSCCLVFVGMKFHLPLKCLKISNSLESHMYLGDWRMAFWTKTGPLARGYRRDYSKPCREQMWLLSHSALRRKSTIVLMHKILLPIRCMTALTDLPLCAKTQYAGTGGHTIEDTARALRELLP